jgi:hypothetical protein
MPFIAEKIHIPDTDLWSTLFDRGDRPFPDDQGVYRVFLFPFLHAYI